MCKIMYKITMCIEIIPLKIIHCLVLRAFSPTERLLPSGSEQKSSGLLYTPSTLMVLVMFEQQDQTDVLQ